MSLGTTIGEYAGNIDPLWHPSAWADGTQFARFVYRSWLGRSLKDVGLQVGS